MSGEKINTIKKDHSSEKLYEAEEQKYMSVAEENMRSTEVVDVIVAVLKMRDTQAGVCTDGNDPVEKKEVMI